MDDRKIPDRARKRFASPGGGDPFLAELEAFVRERRRGDGLLQADLADLAGVSQRFVADLEAGKPTLRLSHVQAVLAVFGKSLGIVDLHRAPEDDLD